MQIYRWKNKRVVDADLFIKFDEQEIRDLNKIFPDASAFCAECDGYYGFVNMEKKTFTPLRTPSLAFGGGYNGYPPYGEELVGMEIVFSELKWKPYTDFEAKTGKDL